MNSNLDSNLDYLNTSFISVDSSVWRSAEDVIEKAELVKEKAIDLLAAVCQPDNEAYRHSGELLSKLEKSELSSLICGELISTSVQMSDSDVKEAIDLFVNLIQIAVNDQFAGAMAPNQLNHDVEDCLNSIFKNDDKSKALTNTPKENVDPGRWWFISAYLNSIPEKTFEQSEELFNSVANMVSERFLDGTRTQITDRPPLTYFRKNAAFRVICLSLRRLGENVLKEKFLHINKSNDEKSFEKYDICTNNQLFQGLRNLLSFENNPLPLAVSLVLRTLGGQYLCKNSPYTAWWKPVFLKGIKFILQQQNSNDGSWQMDEHPKPPSPFLHKYSPLLHILDLDLELIRPQLQDKLILSTMHVLSSVQSEIENAHASLGHIITEDNVFNDVFSSIFSGLSVGTMISNRFKDILSDLLLNSMQAKHVNKSDFKEFPESLMFRKNVKQGIIKRWEQFDHRRPGAILVFGPPGTGKTTVAKSIACSLNDIQPNKHPENLWRFVSISPAHFAREGSDGIVSCAERIFGQLQKVRRCVVLMDEMEEFLRKRDGTSDKQSRLITTAFLPLLQDVIESREIILVVATNFVGNLDSAVTRRGRFDLILPLGPPDKNTREDILVNFDGFNKIENKLRETDVLIDFENFKEKIIEYTMAYTVSELYDFLYVLFDELNRTIAGENTNHKHILNCCFELEAFLWKIRSEKVPTALSGRTGCNWRVFADEVFRFSRFAIGSHDEKEMSEYWKLPTLPKCDIRNQGNCVRINGGECKLLQYDKE